MLNKFSDEQDETNNTPDIINNKCICIKVRYNFIFDYYDEINLCLGKKL